MHLVRCTFPVARSKFVKTQAFNNMCCWSIHWVFLMFFVLSHIHVFRHQKRKNIFGPLSRIGPQKIPSMPNPIPTVGPKGTHSEFRSGPKDQSLLVILYFSLCLCLCLSRYLYFPFLPLCLSTQTQTFSTKLCASLRMWSHQCMRWFKLRHEFYSF